MIGVPQLCGDKDIVTSGLQRVPGGTYRRCRLRNQGAEAEYGHTVYSVAERDPGSAKIRGLDHEDPS